MPFSRPLNGFASRASGSANVMDSVGFKTGFGDALPFPATFLFACIPKLSFVVVLCAI